MGVLLDIPRGSGVEAPLSFKTFDERRVGLVFQEYALFPHMNVRQNVAYAGAARVDEYLERFRISHLANARTTARLSA
jgi:ABC-type sulfate/molybdate transport systems ATPase subunit